MLGEYKVNRCSRRCHALDRPLREGEWYYSVLLEAGEDYIRHDYSAESWKEPPAGAIGWWKQRMPTSGEKKLVLAPPEVLIDLLRQMERFPARAKSRYLLALMLMRRKLLRPVPYDGVPLADAIDVNETANEGVSLHAKVLRVEVIADGSMIDVREVLINRSESESLREELNELLYCEAEPEVDPE
jgi:hypothetical protein